MKQQKFIRAAEVSSKPPTKKSYWDLSTEGTTMTLVSACIRDNPNQTFDQMIAYISQIKNTSRADTRKHLEAIPGS